MLSWATPEMTLQEAIDYIAACRDTHAEYVEYFDDGGDLSEWFGFKLRAPIVEALGDRDFHQECVDGYDEVLTCLKKFSSKTDQKKAP